MAVLQEKGSSRVELINISRFFGDVRAVNDISFTIEDGEFFSLLGPSGCGKTTTLRLIAGLDRPDQGLIKIGDKEVASGQTWLGPEKRGIGIVFQDYALFPHMTVEQNIGFGINDLSKEETRQRIEEMLSAVGLSGLGKRYPHELSGGQNQRVALARSLAPLPKVILLDEPFSNLDADLREELRNETRRILKERGATTILVTHDQEEAFSLSDRVGVLNNGRIEQIGTPADIYHRPTSRFVADFVGKADFVPGLVENQVVKSDIGVFPLSAGQKAPATEVEIMIRPDDVEFEIDAKGNASIVDALFLGASILYKLQLQSGRILHSIKPSTLSIPRGTQVNIKVDTAHIVLFAREAS